MEYASRETLRVLLDHVGEHLESVALSALPDMGSTKEDSWWISSESSSSVTLERDDCSISSSEIEFQQQQVTGLALSGASGDGVFPSSVENWPSDLEDVSDDTSSEISVKASRDKTWNWAFEKLIRMGEYAFPCTLDRQMRLRQQNLTSIVTCPSLENKSFVHRKDIFQRMHSFQIEAARTGPLRVVLLGLAGMG